jgi:hypothetical protein
MLLLLVAFEVAVLLQMPLPASAGHWGAQSPTLLQRYCICCCCQQHPQRMQQQQQLRRWLQSASLQVQPEQQQHC